ncbi:hypothetical protein VPH35_101654 [Triticum aestivum]
MERYFSTDVLADILRRLPPSSRRRARLVCRHWRDVVNSRTTEMQSRASPLIWDPSSGVAYIIDDLSSAGAAAGSCRPLWRNAAKRLHYGDSAVQLVGTCNGLLCLCDNEERAGGAVTVVNPATGEALAVPALPCAAQLVGRHITQTKWSEAKAWHEAYGFAYHPTTGKYKVVHVPCSYERVCEFDAVRGRLGVVTGGSMSADAWVLEKGQGWIHRYVVGQHVPGPHFAFAGGGCVLTVRKRSSFYAHWPKDAPPSEWRLRRDDGRGAVRVGHGHQGMSLVDMGGYSFDNYRTFAYVRTMEPL